VNSNRGGQLAVGGFAQPQARQADVARQHGAGVAPRLAEVNSAVVITCRGAGIGLQACSRFSTLIGGRAGCAERHVGSCGQARRAGLAGTAWQTAGQAGGKAGSCLWAGARP
jgi:hypothetical protein